MRDHCRCAGVSAPPGGGVKRAPSGSLRRKRHRVPGHQLVGHFPERAKPGVKQRGELDEAGWAAQQERILISHDRSDDPLFLRPLCNPSLKI